jgi:hypothetical protein
MAEEGAKKIHGRLHFTIKNGCREFNINREQKCAIK